MRAETATQTYHHTYAYRRGWAPLKGEERSRSVDGDTGSLSSCRVCIGLRREGYCGLATDIEGSTALLGRLGDDDYAQLPAGHHALVRSALAAHEGRAVDTQGDAFFAVFSSPRGAWRRRRRMQVGRISRAQVTAAASGHNVARSTFLNVSEPSADSA